MALVQPKSQSHAPGRPGPRRRVRGGARALGTLALAVGLTTTASGCLSGPGPVARKLLKLDTPYAEGAPETAQGSQERLLARWLTPDKTPHASQSTAPGKTASVVAGDDQRTANTDGTRDKAVGQAAADNAPAPKDDPTSEPQPKQKDATAEPGTAKGLVLGPDGWKLPKAAKIPEADAEMADAEALYQQGNFSKAESALTKIAKKRKGNQYGEKAQYLIAESLYQRGKLVAARDAYELLIKDYPGTQYLDQLVRREYTIALTWLGQAKPATDKPAGPDGGDKPADPSKPGDDPSVTQTAGLNGPTANPMNTLRRDTAPPPEVSAAADVSSVGSRFDGRQPLVDTGSHAVKLLENIRLHDPQGPFADDAAIKMADHYKSVGDYEQAAYYFEQVVTDHPKSPLLQKAQRESIECRLKSYIGPEYDGESLEKARNMVKQTMVNFPERRTGASDDKDELYKALDIISEQEAARAFKKAEWFESVRRPTSAEYYYGLVQARWPNSTWAGKAKARVGKLALVPRKEALPSKIMSAPGSGDPYGSAAGGGGMTGMGGVGPNGMNGP